jgi:hypothetical protein
LRYEINEERFSKFRLAVIDIFQSLNCDREKVLDKYIRERIISRLRIRDVDKFDIILIVNKIWALKDDEIMEIGVSLDYEQIRDIYLDREEDELLKIIPLLDIINDLDYPTDEFDNTEFSLGDEIKALIAYGETEVGTICKTKIDIDSLDKPLRLNDDLLPKFRKFVESVLRAINADSDATHNIIERFLNGYIVPIYQKDLISDDCLQKIINFAEKLDKDYSGSNTVLEDCRFLEEIFCCSLNDALLSPNNFLDYVVPNKIDVDENRSKLFNNQRVIVKGLSIDDVVCRVKGIVESEDEIGHDKYIVEPSIRIGDYDCYVVDRFNIKLGEK